MIFDVTEIKSARGRCRCIHLLPGHVVVVSVSVLVVVYTIGLVSVSIDLT